MPHHEHPADHSHDTAAVSASAQAASDQPRALFGNPVQRDSQARRQWSSQQLLGNQREIEIAHADSIYRLRITSLGKLILTK